MRASIAIAVIFLSVCLAQQANAWLYGGWGLGMGYGLGLGFGGLGWGFPFFRYFRSTMSEGDITNRIQCRYIKEKQVLSCTGATGVVECATIANFTGLGTEHKFELYGLGCDNTVKNVDREMFRYNLYPRSVDNKIWYNATYVVDKVDVRLALFHSLTYNTYYGYRVQDASCFERFVSLFDGANSDEIVEINGVKPVITVPLFGEILEITKPVVV